MRARVLFLLFVVFCVACEEAAEQGLYKIVKGLRKAGYSLERRAVFEAPTADERRGGGELRQAGRWWSRQEELKIYAVSALNEGKPWGAWSNKDWEEFAAAVQQLEPAYELIRRAMAREDLFVAADATVIVSLGDLLAKKAVLAAHRREWGDAVEALRSNLRLALAIGPRAEGGRLARGTFITAFFDALKAVVGIGSVPVREFRDEIDPLLDRVYQMGLDLPFEVEALGIAVLESEMPVSEKREWLKGIAAVLEWLDEQGPQKNGRFLKGLPQGRATSHVRGFVRAHRIMQTQARLGGLGLALVDYRQRVGRWPENLEKLKAVPKSVLTDPMTGRSFAYDLLERGVRCRSMAKHAAAADLSWMILGP